MKIIVDHKKCSGQARCQAVAPVIYELDEEGYNRMPPREVDPGEEALARRGARACPERAITIVDEAD